MEVTTEKLRRCDLVTAKGRIDAETVKTLTQAVAACKKAGHYKIVLNMTAVTFISSIGLGELVNTQKTCKKLQRGELVLAEAPPRIKEALDLAGLTPLFKMFDTEAKAVGNF